MLIVKIKGGLGNQLFQYAFGRQLAINNHTDLNLDSSFFDNANQHRSFDLGSFNLNSKKTAKKELNKYKKANHPLINKILNLLFLNFSVYVESKVTSFNKSFLNKKDGYFEGYWQSEKYFKNIREELLKELTLKKIVDKVNVLALEIQKTEAVSIHIRKTDYLNVHNQNIYADCSANYYSSAIEHILKHKVNPVFYIFSDDFDWVKSNLKIEQQHTYIMGNAAEEDLYLMSICKHHIIANSTFSWWGAWLNKNKNKTVIAPKHWFNKNSLTNHDIIPEDWLKINN